MAVSSTCARKLRIAIALGLLSVVDSDDNLGSVVVDGAWRFTAMTDRVLRIEHDAERVFVDDPTFAFIRSAPMGTFNRTRRGGGTSELRTSRLTITYVPNATAVERGFVEVSDGEGRTWKWGDDPEVGNLRGTARTLDANVPSLDLNCHHQVSARINNSQMHCAWGLVSRAGWAVVNDTGKPILRNSWIEPSRNTVDISIFFHGLDFAAALREYSYVAGPPALPPRYSLGVMFTRWFDFDSDSAMEFVEEWERRSMPLDAFIFDMNWHTFGPWGSFTWNADSFPNLQAMLDWFRFKGLHIGANTHDSSGVVSSEKTYKEMCAALGRRPDGQTLKFDLYNETYAMAMEDVAMRALDSRDGKQGIDFSWIDYQQGESEVFEQIRIPGLNPTIVLNMLRSTDPERHGENRRGLILSRWGGYGNHRYPLGFSGDQKHNWEGLRFLPYFTSTAANVAFNYWSHDTVGGDHDLASDFELSVRWVQVTAWSPVFRFHDKGAATGACATLHECARVVPWDLPNSFYIAVRDAARKRDELLPYIYTAAFDGVGSGLGLVRPMYFEDPMDDMLYGLDKQYLFGPDMVVSPITDPSGPDAPGFEEPLGAVRWQVFAPSTDVWMDLLNGDFVSGGHATNVYGIYDVPALVRQGAVVPLRPRLLGESNFGRAGSVLQALEFRIMPARAFYSSSGFAKGESWVVDDDGISLDYRRGNFTNTTCEYTFSKGIFKVNVVQRGNFTGRPTRVTLRLSFPQLPPMKVVGSEKPSSVDYDHRLTGSTITFEDVDLAAGLSMQVSVDPSYLAALSNFIGLYGRIRRARYVKDALDMANIPYGSGRANLTAYALAGARMSPEFAAHLPHLWTAAVAQVAFLLSSDKTLQSDERRTRFVSKMLGLSGFEEAVTPRTVLV